MLHIAWPHVVPLKIVLQGSTALCHFILTPGRPGLCGQCQVLLPAEVPLDHGLSGSECMYDMVSPFSRHPGPVAHAVTLMV